MEKGSAEYIEFRKRRNIANRKYYSKPEVKAKKKVYKKIYDTKNKEKISAYGKINRARTATIKRVRKWRTDNKEHLKEYRSSPEARVRKSISDRKYRNKRKANPETAQIDLEKQRAYRKKNIEKMKIYNSKYYTSPKGKVSYTRHNHKRLATIKERPCDLTNDKIKEIFERDKVCVYCGSNIKLELDHIVPLKLGGNSLFNNFVIACKKCNTSKSGRDVFWWCKFKKIQVPEIVIKLLASQKN